MRKSSASVLNWESMPGEEFTGMQVIISTSSMTWLSLKTISIFMMTTGVTEVIWKTSTGATPSLLNQGKSHPSASNFLMKSTPTAFPSTTAKPSDYPKTGTDSSPTILFSISPSIEIWGFRFFLPFVFIIYFFQSFQAVLVGPRSKPIQLFVQRQPVLFDLQCQ